ncbi:uncharacterized protein BDV17DRAFT_278716 [Aspergillus undulatus]|uniref:uncharacterized protein n=1 Tax=Aspergillus undulatus TaxID=1810928 RepID=UPI003CCD868A
MELIHDDYTVAWICALPLEMAAAKVVLDETHDSLDQPSTDHNSYTLGRRAGHNVVLACLLSGVYGTTSAATVLSHMLPTFPSLRFGLMVGIGGGVPSKGGDIRLGDVVYDFGKTLRDMHFQRTGSLNKPSQFLLTAISQIRSNEDHRDGPDCSDCDQSRLVNRVPRANEDPCLHYGLIAPGNQVLKDATTRDSIAEKIDILCFEMEAAGLMDQLPCLVIRGICDYCDSHKNKQWQGYAALAAAAYAKILLEFVPTIERKARPKVTVTERHWMVPFHKNSRFVGRRDEIARIEALMNAPPSKIAICGLGGSIEQAYIGIAHILGIKGVKAAEAKSKVKASSSRKEAGKWLLVFDNADDMGMWSRSSESGSLPLTDYLPQHEQGHILFTTRNRKVAVMLASSNVVHVSEPNPETAILILKELLIDKDSLNDKNLTLRLLEELAFLPLAITQAAAYINENTLDFSGYITLLHDQETDVIELLSKYFGDVWRYKDIQNPASSKKKEIDALGLLKAFSFVGEQTQYLNLHRNRKIWREYLPHALSLIEEDTLQKERRLPLIQRVCRCVGLDGRVNEAALLLEEILRTRKGLYGEDHHDTLSAMISLAGTYRKQCRWEHAKELDIRLSEIWKRDLGLEHSGTMFDEAEELSLQILKACECVLGSEDLEALRIMNIQASTYKALGRLDEAEKMNVHLLGASKRVLGSEHPITLRKMSVLACLYGHLERWKETRELGEHTVALQKRILGPEDPHTLLSMKNLAVTYQKMNRSTEAEERVTGLEHSETCPSWKTWVSPGTN